MNVTSADPTLSDLLDLHKKDIFLTMNCHALATIQSFDALDQTVKATVNYTQTYKEKNKKTGIYESVQVDYPVLVDVPVIFLRGGLSGMTMPIKKGDQCLIFFNDRSIDDWFGSGQIVPLTSPRLHSFSDGIALVGLSHAKNSLQNFDQDNPVLYNGVTKVTVKENKVKIENSVESLNLILQDLVTAIKALTTNPVSAGAPATLDAASIINLTNIATRLGGLLE